MSARSRRTPSAAASDDAAGTEEAAATPQGIATGAGDGGAPLHRGWAPQGAGHRWMEPFVLVMLAGGARHGYLIVAELSNLGISASTTDVGQVYRTLRELEAAGQVRSAWQTGSGPARREYELTPAGWRALDEWAAVMKERKRLIGEFDAGYLAWVLARDGPAVAG